MQSNGRGFSLASSISLCRPSRPAIDPADIARSHHPLIDQSTDGDVGEYRVGLYRYGGSVPAALRTFQSSRRFRFPSLQYTWSLFESLERVERPIVLDGNVSIALAPAPASVSTLSRISEVSSRKYVLPVAALRKRARSVTGVRFDGVPSLGLLRSLWGQFFSAKWLFPKCVLQLEDQWI